MLVDMTDHSKLPFSIMSELLSRSCDNAAEGLGSNPLKFEQRQTMQRVCHRLVM